MTAVACHRLDDHPRALRRGARLLNSCQLTRALPLVNNPTYIAEEFAMLDVISSRRRVMSSVHCVLPGVMPLQRRPFVRLIVNLPLVRLKASPATPPGTARAMT